MRQFGSERSITAQNQSAVADSNGNLIVSPDDSFGASPLGIAARTQALYGIPNANLNILPSDPYSPISSGNPLPYWDLVVSGEGTATMVYTDATQSWAVRLDPTAGTASDETITMKTRTYLLNDSNLTLRQKAFVSIAKVGTQATSEWNLVLSATYYDEAGTQLSTYNIGTANSGSAWTTINGFTTSGTAAIEPAAHYADLALTLTTSGSVAGTAMVDINSLLLQTSTGAAGAQSFLLTETFTTSGTFTVPTGVDYVTVVAIGAGQGGQGGSYRIFRTTTHGNAGGNGGSTGYYALARDIYVGDVASVSVGIGAGGAGGTAVTVAKPAGGTLEYRNDNTTAAGGGGDTTFGTYFTVAGARTAPTGFFDIASAAGATGGAGGGTTTSNAGSNGGTHSIGATFTGAPYITLNTAGVAGTSATGSGGTGNSGTGGTANATLGIAGAGAGAGGSRVETATPAAVAGNGGVGGPAGGSGGGGVARYWSVSGTITGTAGNGGDAPANGGGGGGGGGAVTIITAGGTAVYNPSVINAATGKGGSGGSGLLKVIYVG